VAATKEHADNGRGTMGGNVQPIFETGWRRETTFCRKEVQKLHSALGLDEQGKKSEENDDTSLHLIFQKQGKKGECPIRYNCYKNEKGTNGVTNGKVPLSQRGGTKRQKTGRETRRKNRFKATGNVEASDLRGQGPTDGH